MFKAIQSTILTALLAGLVAIGGWWTLFLRDKFGDHEAAIAERDERITVLATQVEERDETIKLKDEEIVVLGEEIEVLEIENQKLETAIALLKIDHRLARIEVLDQEAAPDAPDGMRTRVRFVELDQDGEPLGPGKEVTLDGKVIYVETLVIKFGDQYVEQGDALRGTSICLFRRLFGEDQRPSDGFPLDPAGIRPLPYQGEMGPDPFYDDLWNRFWDYANDAELAREAGVRAIHGEAPFIELRPGKNYRVELRSSGGLTIQPD